MRKPNFKRAAKTIQVVLKKRSPEILTGIGIAGMVTTTAMAVRATPKAILILNEEECRRSKTATSDAPSTNEIGKLDVVKLTWKCYIPSAITGTMSIACLVFASAENAKRNAALATAYSLSESVLRDYQEKVIETIGEKKEQGIRDAIAKDKIERNPVSNQSIIITNKGDTLCYDDISGRYFKTDIDRLKKIENELNRQMLDERYISLNDFYYELGLEGIGVGNDLGWCVDDGFIDLYFTSQLTPDDTPCLVINYRVAPRPDYYKCI
jgi:hypothetical protein